MCMLLIRTPMLFTIPLAQEVDVQVLHVLKEVAIPDHHKKDVRANENQKKLFYWKLFDI